MKEIYERLQNGSGSREVSVTEYTVTAELIGKLPTSTIKAVYVFNGNTNIGKETEDLIRRSRSVVQLDKIEITRKVNRKNVSISVRFLSDKGVLLMSESDVNLLTMSDDVLLKKIGVFVV